MKKSPLVLSLSAALFLLAAVASAQTPPPTASPNPTCPKFGWAEGLVNHTGYPAPPFPTEDTANLSAEDCLFHQWSWEAFVWATAIGADGHARFTTLHNGDELGKSPVAAKGPKPLNLKPRDLNPSGARQNRAGDDPAQAGGGILVDQNGQIVWYSTHMNDAYFSFLQQYGGAGYAHAPALLNFPAGAPAFQTSSKDGPD